MNSLSSPTAVAVENVSSVSGAAVVDVTVILGPLVALAVTAALAVMIKGGFLQDLWVWCWPRRKRRQQGMHDLNSRFVHQVRVH